MEYSYAVETLTDRVEIRFAGPIGARAIITVLEEIGWRKVRGSASGLLWDLRSADLSTFTMDDMDFLRAYDSVEAMRAPDRPSAGPAFRVAAVFQGPSDRLILRLWEAAPDDAEDLERRSFSDLEAARRWIARR